MAARRLILLFLLLSMGAFSQKTKKEQPKKEKKLPENIESFSRDFLVRPRFVYPQVVMNVSSRLLGRGSKFRYMPAIPGVVGLALKIKKVYISAAIQLPASSELKKKYGVSKFRNININIQSRVLQWGLFYRDYKGFYLDNYQDFYPTWNKDSLGYPNSKSLRILEAGLNLGFNFNHNFSLNAAFAQGERQKKSAGSFLMAISERYQRIDADTSFVPLSQVTFYPSLNRLKYGNFASTILSLGVGYQIVVRKFHLTPMAMAGTGLQVQTYYTNRKKFRFNIPTYAIAKAQFGYNGDHFFFNIIYSTEFNSIPISESKIRLFHNWFEVGVGVRF
jgi:hypothetical protein